MTTPSPMTRDELLELAALDAFGLLDDYEAALFTRSFHHAPIAVQDEIKELQASFAADPVFVPDVQPSTDLRRQVLGRVSKAIETESVELAPLAMIGRLRERRSRVGPRSTTSAASHFWRAAAFILAAGNLVFAYISVNLYRDHVEIAKWVLQADGLLEAQRIVGGPNFGDFVGQPISPRHQRIVLTGTRDSSIVALVHVKLDTDRNQHDLLIRTEGLKEHTPYVLTAFGKDTAPIRIEFRTMAGPLHHHRSLNVDVSVLQASTLNWEITDQESGQLVLGRTSV